MLKKENREECPKSKRNVHVDFYLGFFMTSFYDTTYKKNKFLKKF